MAMTETINVNPSDAGIDHNTPSNPMNKGIIIVKPAPKIISRVIESPAEIQAWPNT